MTTDDPTPPLTAHSSSNEVSPNGNSHSLRDRPKKQAVVGGGTMPDATTTLAAEEEQHPQSSIRRSSRTRVPNSRWAELSPSPPPPSQAVSSKTVAGIPAAHSSAEMTSKKTLADASSMSLPRIRLTIKPPTRLPDTPTISHPNSNASLIVAPPESAAVAPITAPIPAPVKTILRIKPPTERKPSNHGVSVTTACTPTPVQLEQPLTKPPSSSSNSSSKITFSIHIKEPVRPDPDPPATSTIEPKPMASSVVAVNKGTPLVVKFSASMPPPSQPPTRNVGSNALKQLPPPTPNTGTPFATTSTPNPTTTASATSTLQASTRSSIRISTSSFSKHFPAKPASKAAPEPQIPLAPLPEKEPSRVLERCHRKFTSAYAGRVQIVENSMWLPSELHPRRRIIEEDSDEFDQDWEEHLGSENDEEYRAQSEDGSSANESEDGDEEQLNAIAPDMRMELDGSSPVATPMYPVRVSTELPPTSSGDDKENAPPLLEEKPAAQLIIQPPLAARKRGRPRKISSIHAAPNFHSGSLPPAPTAHRKKKRKMVPIPAIPSRPISMTPHLVGSKEICLRNANTEEELVPIRIELDVDGNKIRDVFTWNLNDILMTPERFARIFCLDFGLSPSYQTEVAQLIQEQLTAHIKSLSVLHMPKVGLAPVELNVQIDRFLIQDRFYWDLSEDNPLTPEAFAQQLVADLGLGGGEYAMILAHAIREQLIQHHLDFNMVEEEWSRGVFDVIRDGHRAQQWGPSVDVMTGAELQELLKTQERESRRLRRASQKVIRGRR